MSPRLHGPFYPLICLLLVSCGGGGGGGSDPAPTPPGDTTAPDTTLTSTPPARSNQRRGDFLATSNETGVVYEVSVNSGPYGPGHQFGIITLEMLQDGAYTVNVRARDAAGNVDPTPAVFLWTIDTQAPDTTITTSTGAISNSAAATFTLASSETGGTFQASIDGGAYAAVASSWSLTGLADGTHSISVRAVDAVTNADPTPATFAWQIDTQAPDTAIATTTGARSNSAAATFTLTSSETGGTFQASIDGGAYAAVASPWSLTGLADGAHSVSVRAIDTLINIDPTPATFAWHIDTQAPDTAIATTTGARSNSAAATFTLTSSETGGTFEASIDGGTYAAVASPWSLTGLADGAHSVSVRAIDTLINIDPTPATFAWQVDTTPPTARVVFPTAVSYTDAAQLHVRGTAQDANGVASVSVNGVAAVSNDGFAHWSALVPIAVGEHALVVGAVDTLQNANASAASVTVANRGEVVNDLMNLAFDSAGARVLMTDPERRALLAARISDRYVSVISGASRGTGIALDQPAGLVVDGPRALVTDTSVDRLVAIDIATGNRTQLSASPAQPDLRVSSALAYHEPTQRAFASSLSGTVVSIDLANGGTRTVFAGSGGASDPAFANIRGLAIDSSSGTAQLLVADSNAHAIIAIDLATGNRHTISYAAPLDPGNQIGTGPAVYSLGQIIVDSVSRRLLVPDQSASAFAGRLFSIDLATGNRTVLTASTSDIELRLPNSIAFDPAAGQVYVGITERARVFRYDVASTLVTRFVDSNVGTGYVLDYPSGLLFDSASGTAGLYSPTTYPAPTIYRTGIADGVRFAVSNYLGPGGVPLFRDPGNLVFDTRAGMTGKALFLNSGTSSPALTLHGVDLVNGQLSTLATAALPDYRLVSRMALDVYRNCVVVGLTIPSGGSASVVAIDLTSGAMTTVSSLSVGNGPPMYEIGAVAAVPGTFGTTARVFVGVDNNLLAVNGSGDRNFISAAANIGSGPALIKIEDMEVDFPRNRALVASATSQAMQWVDLTSGNRTMASGRNPDDLTMRGSGPALFGRPTRLATDLESNIAYVTVARTAILAVDLESGDRVIMSR